ncbi:MAG: RDD family protein [Gemmatimonadales bacterium]
MTPVAERSDPRSIVTPDAFHVAPDLLGLKLASGRRRLAAILVDLLVISIITAVTRSFALILGIVVAVLLVRAGTKRTSARGTALDRAMRGSVGCLGISIGIVTTIVWLSVGPSGGDSNDEDEVPRVGADTGAEPSGAGGLVRNVLAGAVVRSAFGEAESLRDAEEVTRELVEAAEEVGMGPAELRAVLLESVPRDAAWAGEAPAMIDRLVPASVEAIEPRDLVAVRDEVSLYTTEEALEAYAALLRSGSTGDLDVVRREALEARLTSDVAADTLASLESRLDEMADDLREADEDRRAAEAELDALESRGFFSFMRSLLDELGFGFGWASLYFTVMLTWWKGQTIGKRLLRVRVVRLDGLPINWWVAFERVGGYAAGFATGFLGFLQVFWDANRQMIHDRIVGTVVALDPPQKVLDWQSVARTPT